MLQIIAVLSVKLLSSACELSSVDHNIDAGWDLLSSHASRKILLPAYEVGIMSKSYSSALESERKTGGDEVYPQLWFEGNCFDFLMHVQVEGKDAKKGETEANSGIKITSEFLTRNYGLRGALMFSFEVHNLYLA